MTTGANPPGDQQAIPPGADAGGKTPGAGRRGRRREPSPNMLPGRGRRRTGIERLLVRLVATGGVIGVGVALGAILRSSNTAGWIIGLVVAAVSVILSAILWSSREL